METIIKEYTAKEMFKELGYEIVEENNNGIKYVKKLPLYKTIAFGKSQDTVFLGSDFYSSKEIKAINKQIEELGWLDNGK